MVIKKEKLKSSSRNHINFLVSKKEKVITNSPSLMLYFITSIRYLHKVKEEFFIINIINTLEKKREKITLKSYYKREKKNQASSFLLISIVKDENFHKARGRKKWNK